MSVTRNDVINNYRFLLGREPESEKIIHQYINSFSCVEELRHELLNSDEFINKCVIPSHKIEYYKKNLPIDHQVSDKVLEKMFNRIQDEWEKLSYEEPYWSVLTDDRYKSAKISKNHKQFYETGKKDADLIDIFCSNNDSKFSTEVCLELGCGVGRVTQHLSKKFKNVIAVDISETNLKICRNYMESILAKNVSYLKVSSPSDFKKIPHFDFLYTIIVLQHNPPPIMKYILDILFSKLNKRGGAFFQIPIRLSGYTFNAERYLQSKVQGMEMHALPMHVIFSLLDKYNIITKEIIHDHWTGLYGSYTFFVQKKNAT
jgi:SAM-dependent methyltransferase